MSKLEFPSHIISIQPTTQLVPHSMVGVLKSQDFQGRLENSIKYNLFRESSIEQNMRLLGQYTVHFSIISSTSVSGQALLKELALKDQKINLYTTIIHLEMSARVGGNQLPRSLGQALPTFAYPHLRGRFFYFHFIKC